MAGCSGGYLCLGLGAFRVPAIAFPGGLGYWAPDAVVVDSECSLDGGDYPVVCGVASLSPYAVRVGSDDGLCVRDSVGEVLSCPVAGSDNSVQAFLGVGA